MKCSTDEEFDMLRTLLYDFLAARNAIELSRYNADINAFINEIVEQLQPSIKDYSKKQIDIVLSLVLYEQAVRDNRFVDLFCRFSEILEENGGVY